MNNIYLLGAGASRGTFPSFSVPVASEFGETLASLDPSWGATYPALKMVVDHLGLVPNSWSLEPVWSCIDYYAKLQLALPSKPWVKEGPEMKKAILAVYGTRCDHQAAHVAPTATLASLLNREMQPGDALVSFNYDTIAERVAAKGPLRIRVPAHAGTNDVSLVKPHGSASWTLNRASRSVTSHANDGSPLISSLSANDVDQNREPLVLGAVPLKSELIKEVQAYTPDVFTVISAQWECLVRALREAGKLVVVGYSFPPEDHYGRFLLQEGIRGRRNKLAIEFFELPSRRSGWEKEIRAVFGDQIASLAFRGPVAPMGGAV